LVAAARASTEASLPDIIVGQTADLKGTLHDQVLAFNEGALLAFADINSRGGIFGRRMRLVTLNDDGVPERALSNAQSLVNDHHAQIFFGCVGSNTTQAIEPVLRDSGIAAFGGFAVSDSVRQKCRGVAYFIRATYGREIEQLVQHLTTIGISRIGLVTLAGPVGEEIHKLVADSLATRKLEIAVSTPVHADGSNIPDAARKLLALQPQAVVMFINGQLAADLMEDAPRLGLQSSFYGLSIVSGDVVMHRLGERARGLVIVQAMPYPWNMFDPTILEYRNLATMMKLPIGYYGLEGYMSAKVLADGLKRSGAELNRTRIHAAFRTLQLRYAGMDIDFIAGGHTGSRFVELVQIARNGRYVR
jgi:ABC-type branched-subunit amino acid transport system substrate-binding protein